jgi:hypothetical protein
MSYTWIAANLPAGDAGVSGIEIEMDLAVERRVSKKVLEIGNGTVISAVDTEASR